MRLRHPLAPRVFALASALLLAVTATATAQPAPPKVATLGRCALESGAAIEDCRLTYRTWGALAPARDNVVVLLTWFLGRADGYAGFYVGGPERLVDTTRYHVIAIDAFGNGMSSSPSNSRAQGGRAFPRATMRDAVEAEHRLLTETLGLGRVWAVMGASMGGMQAVQWSVSYPEFMDRVVAIVPTPRTGAYDRVLWGTQLRLIENAGAMPKDSLLAVLEGIQSLALWTPAYVNRTPSDSAERIVRTQADALRARFDAWDWASQLRLMLSHDVAAPYGGSLESAAARVKARTLLVVSNRDHMVTPEAAWQWGALVKAQLLRLDSDCGHLATGCEGPTVKAVVSDFLMR